MYRYMLPAQLGVFFLVVVQLLNGSCYWAASGLSYDCLDNDGNPVPWWFMYKTPGGFEFAYVDSSSTASMISKFDRYMNDTSNPVALTRTLRSLVQENGSWLQYNDQPDVGTASSSYGHSKGVLAVDANAQEGFWLTHSTPKFPSSSGESQFFFPPSETKYGQTFLCMKLSDRNTIEEIGSHLQYVKPFVYVSTIDEDELDSFPNLKGVLDGEWITDAGNSTHGFTLDGRTFTTMSKNTRWGKALWGDLVAPHFKESLVVQSWIRGYAEGPYCPPTHEFSVVDTKEMQMSNANGKGMQTWSEGSDHAKWAIAKSGGNALVCVGDINRMTSQFKRGGGAACFSDEVLHSQLGSVISSSGDCSTLQNKTYLRSGR